MRTRTNTTQDKKEINTTRNGLLSARLFNALPYSSSVLGFYNRTKDSNDFLRLGLNLAENAVISNPLMRTASAVDKFASSQLAKIEDKLDVDLVTKSVGVVAYPVGYSLGLASYAKNRVIGLTTPALALSYELADTLIDKLLPADFDETLTEEYHRMSTLQQKSPFRRIKDRATINNILRMPSSAFNLSWNMVYSSMYLGMGFATMSLERLLRTANTLVDTINVNFESDLTRPWTVVSNGDMIKLYKSVLFYGAKYVNGIIDEVEQQADELSSYLNDHQLPYNSKVVQFAANKLKGIERRLIRIGGIKFMPAEESVLHIVPLTSTITSSTSTPTHVFAAPRQRNLVEDRPASIITGDVQKEHAINYHKAEIESRRLPTMMWGPDPVATRKNPFPVATEFTGEEVIFTEDKSQPKKSNVHKKTHKHHKSHEEVEAVHESVKNYVEPEHTVDPNADAHGYVQVKPSSHGHLIPMTKAKELGEQLLRRNLPPTTPTNSPAEVLNNPFSGITVDGSTSLRGPEVEDAHVIKTRNLENRAHERHLRHKALHELLLKLADVKDKEEKRAEQHSGVWERPKHAVHVHAEHAAPAPKADELPAPKNNPFGKLAEVDADQDPFSMGVSAM